MFKVIKDSMNSSFREMTQANGSLEKIKKYVKDGDLEELKRVYNSRTQSIYFLIKFTSKPVRLRGEKTRISLFDFSRKHKRYEIARWLLSIGLGPCSTTPYHKYMKYTKSTQSSNGNGWSYFVCGSFFNEKNEWFRDNSKWVNQSNLVVQQIKSSQLQKIYDFLENFFPSDIVRVILEFNEDFLIYDNQGSQEPLLSGK